MKLIEVKLLDYTFRFRRMLWREEFNIKFPKGKDSMRVYLAHALVEVSGLSVTPEEAVRIIESLPSAISSRVFRIYKGQLPAHRRFGTASLFKAPTPVTFQTLINQDEDHRDDILDKAQAALVATFGRKAVDEAGAVDRQILKASKLRGATKVEG